MSIKENLEIVRAGIHEAEIKTGRAEGSVKLMAVSKFNPAEAVIEAYNAGQRLFGENRVQEAVPKFASIGEKCPEAQLHLIGSLQRNKVKIVVPAVTCIQSVDRLELVEEIGKQCRKLAEAGEGTKLELMFELHTGEESKSGFQSEDELLVAVEKACSFKEYGVTCTGLMTMAPFTEDDRAVRHSFATLRKTLESVKRRFPDQPFTELSMGMSGDYRLAIEEGSTLVRIGTAIFGVRDYSQGK